MTDLNARRKLQSQFGNRTQRMVNGMKDSPKTQKVTTYPAHFDFFILTSTRSR